MSTNKFISPIINLFEYSLKAMNVTEDDIADAMYDYRLDLPPLDTSIKLELENNGYEPEGGIFNKDISFTAPHEYFLFKKRPVLVYIRDQYVTWEDYKKDKLNKFHFCFCRALDEAKMQHRLENRYIVTTNTRGNFFVNINDRESRYPFEEGIYKRLEVCKDCLREINWKNFRSFCGGGAEWWKGGNYKQRQKIVDQFSIDEFLKSVRRDLFNGIEEISANVAKKEYTLPTEFKNKIKFQRGYKCEKCGKVTVKSDLEIHHINHNEGDNSVSNLMVLCTKCHKKTHRAEGGYIKDSQ